MTTCTTCGTAQTDPSDRFCRSCGTPYAAAAVPPPPPAAPPTAPTAPPTAPPTLGLPPETAAAPRRKRVLLLGVAASIVIALVAGGLVVWSVLRSSGGADSPDKAVSEAVSAMASQDPVGLLDVVAPAEVNGISDLATRLRDRLHDLGANHGKGLTDAVSVKVADVTTTTTSEAGGFARVTLSGGTYTASWDPSKLTSELSSMADLVPAETRSGNLVDLADEADVDPTVITEKVDGRWYVTLVGTGAYQAYEQAHPDEGDPAASIDWAAADHPPTPILGATPEDTFAKVADAISSNDVSTMLSALDPDLVRPLLPYVSWMQSGIDGDSSRLTFHVSDVQVSTEDIGDGKVRATVQQGTLTGDDGEGSSFTASLTDAGRCYHTTSTDTGGYTSDDSGCTSDSPVFGLLGIDAIVTVVLDKVDGGYRFDPVGSVVDQLSTVVDHLNKDTFDKLTADFGVSY